MRTAILAIASIILHAQLVRALNDWNVPCTSGVCSYDLPDTQWASSGTLRVWGPSISDITTAAGWKILDCDPNSAEQDIRLVCTSSMSACEHLYSNSGAEGKIVRLPESCGRSAFARVAKAWVPSNQSVPEILVTRFARVNGMLPEVKALRLDTNFDAIDSDRMGIVQFGIQAKMHTFNKSAHLPINVTGGAVFSQTVSCSHLNLGVEIGVDVTALANVTIDVFVDGTILPPKINNFTMSMGLSADVNGSLTLQADVDATLDSGQVTVFEVGLPGFSFPDIFSLGPTFQINTRAIANFDLALGAQIGINYHLDNTQFGISYYQENTTFVHPSRESNISLHETPFQLSATPFVKASGTVEGHLIPTLLLGITGFKKVQSGIYVALDSAAVLNITLEEVGSTRNLSVQHETLDLKPEKRTGVDHEARVVRDTNASDTGVFEGCFEADAVLDFNVGAEADFFNVINMNGQWTIFQKTFTLYKKCFGNSANTTGTLKSDFEKRSLRRRAAGSTSSGSSCGNSKAARFKCRLPTFMVQVADQTISGTD